DKRSNNNFEHANTTVVIRNRIKPSSSSADFCIPPASLNSLANADAMELEGEKIDDGKLNAFPITKVTAIVSPSARPRPSIMPPITPFFVNGNTTFHTTSHVVLPKPYADSLSKGGTRSNTSRITAEMTRHDMKDRIRPPVNT